MQMLAAAVEGNEHEDTQYGVLPRKMANLVTNVEKHYKDQYVYVYFSDDAALVKTFELFPAVKESLRVCQGLHEHGRLMDDDFLPLDVQRRETLRNVLHLKVLYRGCEEVGDLFFLRGEVAHQDLREIRGRLAPHERVLQGCYVNPPAGVVPVGLFPSHATGAGEGYPWAHFQEYALYTMEAARCAFDVAGAGSMITAHADMGNADSPLHDEMDDSLHDLTEDPKGGDYDTSICTKKTSPATVAPMPPSLHFQNTAEVNVVTQTQPRLAQLAMETGGHLPPWFGHWTRPIVAEGSPGSVSRAGVLPPANMQP